MRATHSEPGDDLVKRLDSDRPAIDRPRVIYADLDGTLLGPGGSLFAMPAGRSSLRAVRAVHELHAAGVELVLASGRARAGMFEPSRLLGVRAYIAELGALLVERVLPDEIVVPNFGAHRGEGSPFDEMIRSGAGAYLIDRFEGMLELHTPWARKPREATMLFRGQVDPAEATAALDAAGYGWLEVHDNGRLHRTSPTLRATQLRAYHLTPKGVSKASAVRLHLERAGIPRAAAAAIGDSRADLDIASEVAGVFIVSNGVAEIDGDEPPANAWATPSSHGDGFAEAVRSLLEGGRSSSS